MSGRRDRSALKTLLRGGAVGRRIRVKAILLSSARRRPGALHYWIEFQIGKGFIPLFLYCVARWQGVALPLLIFALVLGGAVVWAIFVLGHAIPVALRMNSRHEAYMKATGVDTSLQSVLGDRTLWRKAAAGATLREFIAERKRPPTATKPV